jgi:hypothetical protein
MIIDHLDMLSLNEYFPYCVIGAIEISILSKHYETEIDVVNTESGRIDRFGKLHHYTPCTCHHKHIFRCTVAYYITGEYIVRNCTSKNNTFVMFSLGVSTRSSRFEWVIFRNFSLTPSISVTVCSSKPKIAGSILTAVKRTFQLARCGQTQRQHHKHISSPECITPETKKFKN